MTEFLWPVDIGNRALQHCGSEMMDESLGFAEDSKRAQQVSSCYGKLRRAQLRKNVWAFATRRAALRPIATTTMLLQPSMWAEGSTYFKGSIVSDADENIWISKVQGNVGNDPSKSPSQWEPYFGPLTVSLYDSGTSYYAGELVYTTAGDGTSRVYLSLITSNTDNPATATAWDATVTYNKGQVVTYSSVAYQSLIDLNTNNTPASIADWATGTTYSTGNKVNGSDGITYTSLSNSNLGNDPTTDGGVHWSAGSLTPWTTTLGGGSGSLNWLQVGGAEFPAGVALTTMDIIYPLGSGPLDQTSTRNIYRLPSGFVRIAPDDPKATIDSLFWSPSARNPKDWLFENDYIVTMDNEVIIMRFVADVTDVRTMDDLFCEGLAASIAREVCEPLTQSTAKLAGITQAYRDAIFDAKQQNAIEIGSEESPEDELILARL